MDEHKRFCIAAAILIPIALIALIIAAVVKDARDVAYVAVVAVCLLWAPKPSTKRSRGDRYR